MTFCSKESTEFIEGWFPKLDKNTLICQDEAEKGMNTWFIDWNQCGAVRKLDIKHLT